MFIFCVLTVKPLDLPFKLIYAHFQIITLTVEESLYRADDRFMLVCSHKLSKNLWIILLNCIASLTAFVTILVWFLVLWILTWQKASSPMIQRLRTFHILKVSTTVVLLLDVWILTFHKCQLELTENNMVLCEFILLALHVNK